MKRQVIFFNVLSAIASAGLLAYAQPIYAESGHKHQKGHSMEHGSMSHSSEDKMMASYLKIQESLAKDTLDGIASEAKAITHNAALLEKKYNKHSNHKNNKKSQMVDEIGRQAAHLSHGEIEDVRKQFATLSNTLIEYLKTSENENELFTFFCPMKKKYWLQDNDKVSNPFFGQEMSGCGNLVPEIENKPHHDNADGGHKHN